MTHAGKNCETLQVEGGFLFVLGVMIFITTGCGPESTVKYGNARSKYELAETYRTGGVYVHRSSKAHPMEERYAIDKDLTKAAYWYGEAAELGHEWAQFRLAESYGSGQGVESDPSEAVKWYRKASEQGNDWAQFQLGESYRTGQGVQIDPSEAVKWYRKATEQEIHWAEYRLGESYATGQGVEKDINKAVEWFQSATVRGNSQAREQLQRIKQLALVV